MKAKNGLLLFTISLLLASCFDAPNFSDVPSIKLLDLWYSEAADVDAADSLNIKINFEDGDGNLGLDDTYASDPFHKNDFYVATDGGSLLKVTATEIVPGYFFLNIPNGTSGALAVARTSKVPPFDDLMPAYDPTGFQNCSYTPVAILDSVLIDSQFKSLVDDGLYDWDYRTYRQQDDLILVKDTFYITPNPNFYNIDVHFLKKTGADTFEELDFATLNSCTNFNGRFPVLSDKENPLSGEITYSMYSGNFEGVMGNNIWKLKIVVRDRTLKESTPIFTKEFTLAEIRR